jgi:integrase/recombinase XerD
MTSIVALPQRGSDLLEPFLSAQMRDATRTAYRTDLIEFFGIDWITEAHVKGTGFEDVEQYRNQLASVGIKPSTINRKLTSLRSFFKRCVAIGLIDRNPASPELVRGYKTPQTSMGKAVDTEKIEEMIEIAYEAIERPHCDLRTRVKAARDSALIILLVYTGMRRSEAANLKWSDIQREGEHTVAVLRDTKSGHEQRVKLSHRVCESLDTLLNYYRESMSEHPFERSSDGPVRSLGFDYVFVGMSRANNWGGRIRPEAVSSIIQWYGKKVGIKITAHSLRHTCATLALEGGATIQKVQSHLRHATVNTTMRYYTDRDALNDNASDYILIGSNQND